MTEIRPCIWRFIRIVLFAGISEFQATALGGTMTHSNPRHLSRLNQVVMSWMFSEIWRWWFFVIKVFGSKNWKGLGESGCWALILEMLHFADGIFWRHPSVRQHMWHCAATICPWNPTTFVPSRHLLWIESCWHPGSSGHQGRHPPGAPSCHNLKALIAHNTEMWTWLGRWLLPASPCKDLIFCLKLAALEMPMRWETRFLQISTHLRAISISL